MPNATAEVNYPLRIQTKGYEILVCEVILGKEIHLAPGARLEGCATSRKWSQR